MVINRVVRRISDQTAESQAQRKEYLRAGFEPHDRILQTFPFGLEQVDDPVLHPFQSDAPEEEDDQHHVRVDGRHVDDLGVLSDAFDDAQIDQDPRGQQTPGYDEVEVVRVLDVVRNVEGVAVPKVLSGAARLLHLVKRRIQLAAELFKLSQQ